LVNNERKSVFYKRCNEYDTFGGNPDNEHRLQQHNKRCNTTAGVVITNVLNKNLGFYVLLTPSVKWYSIVGSYAVERLLICQIIRCNEAGNRNLRK